MTRIKTFCARNRGVLLALLSMLLSVPAILMDILAFLHWKSADLTLSSGLLPAEMVVVGLITYAVMILAAYIAGRSDPGRCLITGEVSKYASALAILMHSVLYLGYWTLNFAELMSGFIA